MSHKCHAFKCAKEVPPKMFMCLKHWKMVPKFAQDDIWRTYRRGQETDKRPSSDYIKATQRAIACVIAYEAGAKTPQQMLKVLEELEK